MEYSRTNPQTSPPTSLIHTHIRRRNLAGLLVHLQRQYNPTGLPVRSQGCTYNPTGPPVRSQGCTYNPTGLPVRSQGCTLAQNPNQDAPLNLSPLSRVLCFYTIYLIRDSTAQRVCSPGAGFNPPEFSSSCGLPVSCCLATSELFRARSKHKR